jgi:hypothetical protein
MDKVRRVATNLVVACMPYDNLWRDITMLRNPDKAMGKF